MYARRLTSMGRFVAAICMSGCASRPPTPHNGKTSAFPPHRIHPLMSAASSGPNAGITVTSSTLAGGPYANGEIKVISNNAAYATQWCPYRGTPPTNPVWRDTATGPNNPGQFLPVQWLVMLKANQAVNFALNPVSVTVVAGQRTRISVTYP